MTQNLTDPQVWNLIQNEITLPTPPAIAVKILKAFQTDDLPLRALGEIISIDPALTAMMLKVANTGIYAHSGKITNINRAVTILGTKVIKNIALSFVISTDLRNNDESGFDCDSFWRSSITAAVSAELVSKIINYADEDIFVASLLQNIGMMIIAQSKGSQYCQLLKDAFLSNAELIDLERNKYGFDHQQVGYALLMKWNLPEVICEPILSHHRPEQAREPSRKRAKILSIADQLSRIYSETETAERARLLQWRLVKDFELDEAQALKLLDDAATSSAEIIQAFEVDPGDMRPYSLLLQEANNELGKLNLSNNQLILEMNDAKEKREKVVHELQDANSRLRALVYRDGLTGLYNHRYFHESLENEMARATRYLSKVSLIIIDIDFFKKINDEHGHPTGDLVLMNIARALSNAVRPNDVVARYGGDEFVVILPETDIEGVKVFAARLRRCVEGVATLVKKQEVYVTVSTGGTTFCAEQASVTKDLLIATADRGLYISKADGRNKVTILNPI